MDVPGPERRLAAVVAADMVGYSRLMEVDETGTLARLKTHRIELIDPAIAKNRGRIIKTTGDGMLVEFHSVADAVLCAAEVQRRMARRNADVSPARWMQFRIGINLGDVIVDENDIFGDGVTEDIITELSRFHDLLVISRNSTFVYKGKAVKVQEVAREFGVEYVLEGSVRKVGDRIRVTVQLIDAETDRHIWAERYDRELEDIFAIQDEMTCAIVATLPGRVEAATHDRAKRKPTDNMAAYECVLAAKVLHHRSIREDNAEAQRLLDRALALDPNYAHAHAWKGCVLGQEWTYGWCADRDSTFQQVAAELET